MAVIIDGKSVSAGVRAEIAEKVAALSEQGKEIGLAVILVGNDPASHIYVNNKKKACAQAGIRSYEFSLPAATTQDELLEVIHRLNENEKIDGILCQLPLPGHINEKCITDAIAPEKDVDAFHPYNVGRISDGRYTFLPCTPAGIMELLRHENIDVAGKHCVIVGRSNIVGKPMAMLMLNADATVTVCHSKTENLAEITRTADILVAAVGRARFITGEMVKDSAVVIDVGINRLEDGTLCGDVDFASVEPKASYITPVPGGVGPMTIAMLLNNTLTAAHGRDGR